MKSTNSLNKLKDFLNKYISMAMIINNCKRFWSLSLLYFIILFIAYPLTFFIQRSDGYIYNVGYYNMFQDALHLGGYGIFVSFCTVLLAFALGLSLMSYLHRKDEMIFTHSLPMSKLKIYISSFLSVMVLLFTPLILITGILSIEKIALSFTAIRLLDVLRFFLSLVIIICFTYVVTAFCCVLCGTSVFAGLLTILLSVLPFIICVSINGAISMYLKGGLFDEDVLEIYAKYSPLIRFMNLSEWRFSWGSALIYILIGVLLFAFGYFLYKIRKNERTTDSLVFDVSKTIIKYLIVSLSVLPFALLFGEIYDYSAILGFIGGVLGIFISYFAMQMLIDRSFFVWRKYKGFVICVLCFLVIVLFGKYDVFGYGTYVPNVNDIESVYVSSENDGGYYIRDYGYAYGTSNGAVTTTLSHRFTSDEETINKAIELSKKLGKVSISQSQMTRENNIEGSQFEKYYIDIEIVYKLNNGKLVKRHFITNIYDVKDELISLINSRGYKEAQLVDLMNADPTWETDFTHLRLNSYISGNEVFIDDVDAIKEIVDAIKEDYLNNDMNFNDKLVEYLYYNTSDFEYVNKTRYLNYIEKNPSLNERESVTKNRFSEDALLPLIRLDFTKTIEVLNKYGYYSLIFPTDLSVDEVRLYKIKASDYTDNGSFITEEVDAEYSVDNAEQHIANIFKEGKYVVITNKEDRDKYLRYSRDRFYYAGDTLATEDGYAYFAVIIPSNYYVSVFGNEYETKYSYINQCNVIPQVINPEHALKLNEINEFGNVVEIVD